MPVKIRLQRHGKKGKPFYWIVAADARAKRDGRYLEKLGTYNPNTNPATVNIKLEDAVTWLEKGAQPTDTARTLLSYKGVMLKHHLNGGIRKGALTQEEADKKFAAWLEEKEGKIQAKKDGLSQTESDAKAKRLADEKAVSDKRLTDAAAAEAEAAAAEAEAAAAEATEESAVEETQVADAPEENAVEETPAAETTEEITADEAPVAEAPVAEAPAEEDAKTDAAAPEAEETKE
jgi:small subunit ribosomal protein S16